MQKFNESFITLLAITAGIILFYVFGIRIITIKHKFSRSKSLTRFIAALSMVLVFLSNPKSSFSDEKPSAINQTEETSKGQLKKKLKTIIEELKTEKRFMFVTTIVFQKMKLLKKEPITEKNPDFPPDPPGPQPEYMARGTDEPFWLLPSAKEEKKANEIVKLIKEGEADKKLSYELTSDIKIPSDKDEEILGYKTNLKKAVRALYTEGEINKSEIYLFENAMDMTIIKFEFDSKNPDNLPNWIFEKLIIKDSSLSALFKNTKTKETIRVSGKGDKIEDALVIELKEDRIILEKNSKQFTLVAEQIEK